MSESTWFATHWPTMAIFAVALCGWGVAFVLWLKLLDVRMDRDAPTIRPAFEYDLEGER